MSIPNVKAKNAPAMPGTVYVPTPRVQHGNGGKCPGMNEAPRGEK